MKNLRRLITHTLFAWAILALAVVTRCKGQDDTVLQYRFHEKDVSSLVIEIIEKPAVYARLWQEVVTCNGKPPVIPYDSTFFALVHAPNGFLIAGRGPFVGYTLMRSGRQKAIILILAGWQVNEQLVKHEMLHAQLGPDSEAHPQDASERCHLW